MTLENDLRAVLAVVGGHERDIPQLVADEHLRYELYIEALRNAEGRLRQVSDIISRDPDFAMREAALTAYIDEIGSSAPHAVFSERVEKMGNALETSDYARVRCDEWREMKRMADVDFELPEADVLLRASDWLQLKLSESAKSTSVLETLAASGRTRRIRNRAKNRLHELA